MPNNRLLFLTGALAATGGMIAGPAGLLLILTAAALLAVGVDRALSSC